MLCPSKPPRASTAVPPGAIFRAVFAGSLQRHRSAEPTRRVRARSSASRYIDTEIARISFNNALINAPLRLPISGVR